VTVKWIQNIKCLYLLSGMLYCCISWHRWTVDALPFSVRFQHRLQHFARTSAASRYKTKHFSSRNRRRAEAKYLEYIYCSCGL